MSWFTSIGLWLADLGEIHPPLDTKVEVPVDLAERLRYVEHKRSLREVQLSNAKDQIKGLKDRLAQSAAPNITPVMMDRTIALVKLQEKEDKGGEAKRHAVYAQLIKDFPAIAKRELALAIEVALIKEG